MLTDQLMVVINATSKGAVQELQSLQKEASKTDRAFDTMGKKIGLAGSTIKSGLVAGAAALVGTGLVAYLQQSASAYGDAAKGAGELANATGSTVGTVSRLQAALMGSGIDAERSAGLLTKFTTSAARQKDLLADLGVELRAGAGGTVDYADAMVQAVDAINGIGDAGQRNAALVKLFGKQGAAAFNELAASGVSLRRQMELVAQYQVFTPEDVARAAAYDDAVDGLAASAQGLQFALGRALVPALTLVSDGVTGVLDVMLAVPGPVYAAAGAAGVLAFAVRSTLVQGALGAVMSVGPKVVGTLTAIQSGMVTAGAAAGYAASSAAAGMATLAKAAGPLVLVAGLVYAVSEAFSSWKDVKARAVDIDTTTMSLREQAEALNKTDGAWRTFVVGNNVEKSMMSITKALRDQAEATLDSADATEVEKQRAKELIGVLGEGTLQQQTNNLATEEGRAAQQAYAQSLSASEMAAQEAATAQEALADAVQALIDNAAAWDSLQLAAGLQEIASAATEANLATLEQEQAANLAEAALGIYAVSIQGVVDWQDRLAGSTSSAESQLGKLQETLGKVGAIVDDPATWTNEVVLNTANATQDLYEYVEILANSGLTAEQIIPVLVDLQNRDGTSTEADALIQQVIDAISGKGNEVPPVNVTTALDPGSAASTKTGLDALAAPKTTDLTVNTTFGPDGYNAAKSRKDFLLEQGTTSLDIDTRFSPDGYGAIKARKDFLAQDRRGLITIDTVFAPGGYNAVKARVDYLAQNRSATITVNQVTGRSTVTVPGQEGRALNVIRVPEVATNPINLVRVNLDGQQLRAVIRDEFTRVRAADDYRAALGWGA